MLIYSQTKGTVTGPKGQLGKGWAGNGKGKNNPALQELSCVGPLPQGLYTIRWLSDEEATQHHLGPMIAQLTPDKSNKMFGRDAFYIHGPAVDPMKYGQESKGCIVLIRPDRLSVKNSGDNRLQVVA